MSSTVEKRLLIVNWCVVAAAATTLLILLAATGFAVKGSNFRIVMAVLGGTLALSSSFLIWSGTARWPNFSHAANVLAQLIIGTMLIAPIAYIAASANYPLQDAKLYAIDQLLGLDWRSYLNFVNEHELGGILKSGYATFLLQPVIVTIILCASGNVVRSYQFSLVFFLALLVTVLISVFLPAAGTFTFLGLSPSDYPNLHPADDFDHMRHLPLLRDGKLRIVDLAQLTGIVTFPSFHAAGAILYLWAFWAVRWMRPVALACNGLLVLATPIDGGHYFIDVIAGISLAIFSIWTAQSLTRALRRDLMSAAPTVVHSASF